MSKAKANTVKGVQALLRSGVKGEYSSGNGLYLSVNGANTGSWIMRYQLGGKRQRMGLGSTDVVSLADARELVAEKRALLAQGIDPKEEREAVAQAAKAEVITFDMVAADYIEAKRKEWRREKQGNDWQTSLNTYASPIIGYLAPADITTEHILEVLSPIWQSKHETARKVRNRVETVLNAAKVRKLREGENVAAWRGHLELLMGNVKKKQKTKHHPALPYEQAQLFWEAIKRSTAMAAPILMLKMLTGVRSSEIRFAHWDEFDLKEKVWTIPANRMKTDVEHRVPLSSAALELLATIPKVPSGLLFEGQKAGQPLSDMTMVMLLRRMDAAKFKKDGIGWRDRTTKETIVPHGFRSTLRDWLGDKTATPHHVCEQVLAHKISSDVEAAYSRSDLLEQRRDAMERWGSHVTGGNVVPLLREA